MDLQYQSRFVQSTLNNHSHRIQITILQGISYFWKHNCRWYVDGYIYLYNYYYWKICQMKTRCMKIGMLLQNWIIIKFYPVVQQCVKSQNIKCHNNSCSILKAYKFCTTMQWNAAFRMQFPLLTYSQFYTFSQDK